METKVEKLAEVLKVYSDEETEATTIQNNTRKFGKYEGQNEYADLTISNETMNKTNTLGITKVLSSFEHT